MVNEKDNLYKSGYLKKHLPLVICVGLAVGFLSGFFGIGGGSIIIPVLVAIGFSQRIAGTTSLVAILPIAAVGAFSYISSGDIDWPAAAAITAGAVIGAQIGAALLVKLPEAVLRWGFAVLQLIMAIMQFTMTPNRGAILEIEFSNLLFLFILGIVTGVLSGVFGIGGGFVVVTGYTFFLGGSDVVARGTSLLTMIPTAISGTVRNLKNKLTDVRTALVIGFIAAAMTPLGKMAMQSLPPRTDAILVGVFLCALVARSVYTAARYKGNAD